MDIIGFNLLTQQRELVIKIIQKNVMKITRYSFKNIENKYSLLQ